MIDGKGIEKYMKLHFETPRLRVYDATEEEIPKIIDMEILKKTGILFFKVVMKSIWRK